MEKLNTVSAVFDYTSFLGASCQKKWTLAELLSSLTPAFDQILNSDIDHSLKPEERLWKEAFNILSAQSSDEVNLVQLLALAKQQGIDELYLMMPYELDVAQLDAIATEADVAICHTGQDEFRVQLTA